MVRFIGLFIFVLVNITTAFRTFHYKNLQSRHLSKYYMSDRSSDFDSDNIDFDFNDYDYDEENINENEVSRLELVKVVEETWKKVNRLIPPYVMLSFEEELRVATTMLVLASVRKSAEDSPDSRAAVESMFRAADVNDDGQLTFIEWYEWLALGDAMPKQQSNHGNVYDVSVPDDDDEDDDVMTFVDTLQNRRFTSSTMIKSLSKVVSQAVCSLKVMSRLNQNDGALLVSSFIAGGLISGEVDEQFTDAMLDRLPSRTQELVALALSLEEGTVASVVAASRKKRKDITKLLSESRSTTQTRSNTESALGTSNSNNADTRDRGRFNTRSLEGEMNRRDSIDQQNKNKIPDIIQTIDLSSIPILTAPPINDNDEDNTTSSSSGGNNRLNDGESDIEEDVNLDVDTDIDDGEAEVLLGDNSVQLEPDHSISLSSSASSSSPSSSTNSMAFVGNDADLQACEETSLTTFRGLQLQSANVVGEIDNMRITLRDMDDRSAEMLRKAIYQRAGGSTDVLGLSMALRTARLQHASRLGLPAHLKHQLAIDTLQLWAPLSFRAGLATKVPELEVHSYVLLFPNSFGNFIDWYFALRPIARALLSNFRKRLEQRMHQDSLLSKLASKVSIQSRLKTPPSAFKKMVRANKRANQLHDLLGMRIVIQDRQTSYVGEEVGQLNNEEAACWRIYNILSQLTSQGDWKMLHRRTKDYISRPKPSGYQSLHLCLLHPKTGFLLELQIRSARMHRVAEHGPASHSFYKALLLPQHKL